MQIPFRVAAALNSRRSAGMLLALGYSTVVMVSTPFLIPEISDHYGVSLTMAGLVSVCQLAGFAVGSWGSGRWLTPNRAVLVASLVASILANLLSALLPPIGFLLIARSLSGLSLGVIAWFAWANAFGREQSMSRVAVVGPIIGVVAAPAVALIISRGGLTVLFLTLSVLPVLPLAFAGGVPPGVRRDRSTRQPAVTTAKIVLLALTAFSLGGSAVFQFGVTIGAQQLGLASSATAIGYTANSLISIPAAGWSGARGIPSPWMMLTAVCAFFLATAYNSVLFFAAIVLWGLGYWMAMPGVFAVLAKASAFPEERAGDAQAMMALGRVGGPLLGGLLLDGPGTTALGIVGSGLMLSAAAGVFTVREATRHREPAAG